MVEREQRWLCPEDHWACTCANPRGCTGKMELMPIKKELYDHPFFDTPNTEAMKAFIAKEGPSGTGRCTGMSIEPDGVFLYTDSSKWCDDAGGGTYRGDSETAAIRRFKDQVQPYEERFHG